MRIVDISWNQLLDVPPTPTIPIADYRLIDMGTVAVNSRYVRSNPFGAGARIVVSVDVYYQNSWFNPGFYCHGYSDDQGCGVSAGSDLDFASVVVQTGDLTLVGVAEHGGASRSVTSSLAALIVPSAPCRVHCWRVGV